MTRTSLVTIIGSAAMFLPLSACSGDNSAAIAATDRAYDGVSSAGVFAPVAARSVRVGLGERRADACSGRMSVTGDAPVAVQWAPGNRAPAKAAVEGQVLACEADGAWTGIVFPAPGQSLGDCNLSRRIGGPTDYQGPCRWGWVETAKLAAG
jgi:hypothetical protein